MGVELGPGFKYHIVTISAIFFALTIGLVVGSVFVSPQFVNRQERLIGQLQHTFNSDLAESRAEVARYKECLETITPAALKGKLSNQNVIIIETGDYPDDTLHVADAIGLASPRVVSHLTITPTLDRRAEDLRRLFSDLQSRNPQFPSDRDALFQQLASILGHGDSLSSPTLPILEREEIVRLTADETYAAPVRVAIIVMGSRKTDSLRATRVDSALIRALLKQGITVVACEGTGAASSDIPALRGLKGEISTVDNVDTNIGQCALVLAVSGPRGDYGVKQGASRLLPTYPAP